MTPIFGSIWVSKVCLQQLMQDGSLLEDGASLEGPADLQLLFLVDQKEP